MVLIMSDWTLRNRSIHPVTPIAYSPSLSESVSLSMADSVSHADGFDDPALPAAQRADHQECTAPSPGEVRMDRIERTLQMVTSQLARLKLPPSVTVPGSDLFPHRLAHLLFGYDIIDMQLYFRWTRTVYEIAPIDCTPIKFRA
jgi:hypothetical protein